MNDVLVRRFLWAVALVVCAGGAVLALRGLSALREAAVELPGKQAELRELRAMAKEAEGVRRAREACERRAGGGPASLVELLAKTLPGATPDDSREQRSDIDDAWTLRERHFTFNEIPLADMMRFVTAAESATNGIPWRLKKCVIRASARATGHGQVDLVMDTLEKRR